MADRIASKLLAVGIKADSTPTTSYTVPAGHTTIVKSLVVTNGASIATAFILYMSYSLQGTQQAVLVPTLQGGTSHSEQFWTVLPEGWRLAVSTYPAAQCFYWISGAELLGTNEIPTVPSGLVSIGALPSPGPIPGAEAIRGI